MGTDQAVPGAVDKLVLDLAPEIGRWLFGPNAAPAIAAMRDAVEQATGTAEPKAQTAALADPDVASQLRVRLAGISADCVAAAEAAAQARLATHMAELAAAHGGTAHFGTAAAWGAPAISLVVLVTFGGVVALTLLRSIPPGAEPVLNVLLGTLGAMATSVVGYWVGSSAGSARKDERLATIAERAGPPA